ncbi:MAG: hypothetical protein KatS3mg105_0179 [Gemmatales bacterium]|nr:MAG: hypothetical protein KatS3mg105_0179 [Gemmatales bacterium]
MKKRAFLFVAVALYSVSSFSVRGDEVDDLLKKLDEPNAKIRDQAVAELAKLGKQAVPKVVAEFKKKQGSQRYREQLLKVLGELGPELGEQGVELRGELLTLIAKNDPKLSPLAAQALGKFGKSSAQVFANFYGNFKNNPTVRRYVIEGIGYIGSEMPVEVATKFFRAALKSETDPAAGNALLETIAKVGKPAAGVADILTQFLVNDKLPLDTRLRAAVALRRVAPENKEVRLAIDAWFADQNLRKQITDGLGKLGDNGLELLLFGVESPDKDIRYAALEAIKRQRTVPGFVVKGVLPVLKDENVSNRQLAAEIIAKVDTKSPDSAGPLGEALETKDAAARKLVLNLLNRMGTNAKGAAEHLGKLLLAGDADELKLAFGILTKLKADAAPATPYLLELLKDEGREAFHPQAISLIIEIGKPAAPGLIKGLKDQNVSVRRTSAQLLGHIPGIVEAPKNLAQALNDEDEIVRSNAANSLIRLNFGVKIIFGRMLSSDDPQDRFKAVQAIAKLKLDGEKARETIPLMIDLLKDKAAPIRQQALLTLKNIGLPATPAIPAITDALLDQDMGVKQAAIEALAEYGPQSMEAVPYLGEIFLTGDPRLRPASSNALSKIGTPSLPVLVAALGSKDKTMRRDAALAMGGMQLKARPAVAILAKSLADPDDDVKKAVLIALKEIGPAPEAVPGLAQALATRNAEIKTQALLALANYGAAAGPAVDAIVQCFKDNDKNVQSTASTVLFQIRNAALNGLIKGLKDPNKQVRLHCCKTLARFPKAQAGRAVKPLEALVKKEKDDEVKKAAQDAVNKLK